MSGLHFMAVFSYKFLKSLYKSKSTVYYCIKALVQRHNRQEKPMMPTTKISIFMILALLLVSLSACSPKDEALPAQNVDPDAAHASVTLDFEKQSGYATNQFAVWVEDSQGNLLQTLYATRFTAGGGYRDRPDAIPQWI